METQKYENYDNRTTNYDISPVHFKNIFGKIADLRDRCLLFDIVIQSGDKSFNVS